MVALPGPRGEKGEPGPPGFGLPGKQVSSGACGGGIQAGLPGSLGSWCSGGRWECGGASASVPRGSWPDGPLPFVLGHSMAECAERPPTWDQTDLGSKPTSAFYEPFDLSQLPPSLCLCLLQIVLLESLGTMCVKH